MSKKNKSAAEVPRLSGKVVAFNLGPKGQIEGVMLDTPSGRAQLNFPRHRASCQRAIDANDRVALETALELGDGPMAHPSPDHYLPLLYVMGAARPTDRARHPITGFDLGSLSMRTVVLDAP